MITHLPKLFQSTHPARGGTKPHGSRVMIQAISIHPPREGWDAGNLDKYGREDVISIHPPREGWDGEDGLLKPKTQGFQSTHPARGGTIFAVVYLYYRQ